VAYLCVQEVCLHAMVAGGHDNAVVLAALRQLRAPEVLRLTAYLSKWTKRHPGEIFLHLSCFTVLCMSVCMRCRVCDIIVVSEQVFLEKCVTAWVGNSGPTKYGPMLWGRCGI
jgi:hypothetical protein